MSSQPRAGISVGARASRPRSSSRIAGFMRWPECSPTSRLSQATCEDRRAKATVAAYGPDRAGIVDGRCRHRVADPVDSESCLSPFCSVARLLFNQCINSYSGDRTDHFSFICDFTDITEGIGVTLDWDDLLIYRLGNRRCYRCRNLSLSASAGGPACCASRSQADPLSCSLLPRYTGGLEI